MARIRSVHPGLFTDEAFMALSSDARVLMFGLWCESDDQGVFEWKPLTIKARILPVNDVDVKALLAELSAEKIIRQFEASGKVYGAIRNFRKFQRPQKPTAQFPLPDDMAAFVGLSATTIEPLPDGYDTPTGKSPQMEDGGDKMKEEGKEEVSANADSSSDDDPSDIATTKKTYGREVRLAFDSYNLTAERLGLPLAKTLTDERRKKICARLKAAGGMTGWHEALALIETSDFLTGRTDRGFLADLDFVCQAKSFQRLIEGYYSAKGPGPPNNGNGRRKSGMMGVIEEMLSDDDDRQRQSEDPGDWSTVHPRCLPSPRAGRN